MLKRRFAALTRTAVFGLGAPATALAKCNAGNGNGSESLADTGHCFMGDPGNSYNVD